MAIESPVVMDGTTHGVETAKLLAKEDFVKSILTPVN